jgi:hypothetical protein
VFFLIVGVSEYRKSQHPNACVVDFSKSLGGKASLVLKQSTDRNRYYGISAISVGGIFTLAGCTLLLKIKK